MFDFGNVIINLDLDMTRIEFAKILTIEGAIHTKKKLNETQCLQKYEVGAISEQEFFQCFRDCSENQNLTDTDIHQAWLALLLDIPYHRIEMLRALRKNYGVYMLSNINHSHATAIHQYLEKEYQISEKEWRSYFDKMYYSHEIGHRKPNASAFEYTINDAQFLPEETLFIDDLEENIAAARKLGFQAYLHDPKDDIVEILHQKFKMDF